MTPTLKIGLAQFNPTIGDLDANLSAILERVSSARQHQIDLLVFPELSLTGYPPRDLLFEDNFVKAQLAGLDKIRDSSAGLHVICGYVAPNAAAQGRPFYNAAAVFSDGKQIATYHKQLLPYYDVFDEPRYFEPGRGPIIVNLGTHRVGLSICEDIWNEKGFLNRPYQEDPIADYEGEGLDLLVTLSASPFHLGKPAARRRLLESVSKRLKAPVAFCNQVGANDELLFDGGSLIARGTEVIAAAPYFQESLVMVELSSAQPVTVTQPEDESGWLAAALEMGIRDYVRKCGGSDVVVGVSGGIDSAVVVTLAARALGPKKVHALSLPTRFTSAGSQSDAKTLCERLGVSFRELSIEPLFEKYRRQWHSWFGEELEGLSLENIQPRIRMTLLMALANEKNAMLLNTSNKSEIATGYATLYGDSAGALSVLGDLTKHQVYALARSLAAIPKGILDRPPSAELREGQTDSQSLPDYPVLDRLVEQRVLWGKRLPQDGEADTRFSRLYGGSEFKRAQLPPVLRVSPKAFGTGRRFPIAKGKSV